jgi:hypothetical protein
MKGLDIAELFFAEFGLPALKQRYPELADRVSAGLMGRGSDVLGADDEWSRDHGWGPRFCLFLNEEDWLSMGGEVEAQLNALRPPTYCGIDLARYRTDQITVLTVDRCYRDLTGSPWPPQGMREWFVAGESALCQAKAGRVFYDPLGRLQERKRAFESAYYPEPIWKWRVASRLYRLWHHGDYNLCDRLLKRQDGVAALVGQGYFVEAAMQLAFLLNRRFAPYWKWLHWGFVRLPYLADRLEPLLSDLETSTGLKGRTDVIGAICDLYREALCEQSVLPDREWRNFMGSFEIVDGIRHPEVKALIEKHFDRYGHL